MTPEQIITITAAHFKVPQEVFLKLKTKSNVYAHIKHIAMYLCCLNTGYTGQMIGGYFDNSSHSVVSRAKKLVEKLVSKGGIVHDHVKMIQAQVNRQHGADMGGYDLNAYDELFKAYAEEKRKNRRLQAELEGLKGKELSVA
jgi:hypothetical protein